MAAKPFNLSNHPEAANNGYKYFNYENRIPQETVPRFDRREMYQGPYDLTETDLMGLAIYANTLLNKDLLRYTPKDAAQDALDLAIRDKDNGKFDKKLNYNTYQTVLSYMMSIQKPSKANDKKASEVEAAKKSPKKKEKDEPKEKAKPEKDTIVLQKKRFPGIGEEVSKVELRKVLHGKPSQEITIHKKRELGLQASEDGTMAEPMSKYAAVSEKFEEHLKQFGSLKQLENKPTIKRLPSDIQKEVFKEMKEWVLEEIKRIEGKEGTMDKPMNKYAAVSEKLDKIAAAIEGSQDPEIQHLALQIDRVSDEIDAVSKSAATLEGDKDESYMKSHFKAGDLEGDKDEASYMKSFNIDKTTEVEKVKTQKGPIRKASAFPYQKVE